MRRAVRASVVGRRTGTATVPVAVDDFVRAVRAHDHELRMLAHRLLGGAGSMDDVLQEAYLKAFRSLGSFRGRASLRTWLYRIVYNACLDELRRPRLVLVPLSTGAEPSGGPCAQDRVDTQLALAAALSELPVRQRAAVLLVDAQAFTYGEAAEVLGVPDGTVATWVSRGRRRLRAALEIQDEAVGR